MSDTTNDTTNEYIIDNGESNEDESIEEESTDLIELNQANDLCVICLSQLGEDDYSLDCNHKYHTKCIIEWFRKGNSTCPLCNDNPLAGQQNEYYYYGSPLINERCSLIRRKFGRNKHCPPPLKRAIVKLRELEGNKKESEKILKDFKNDPIVKEYRDKGKQLSKEVYKHNSKIRNQKIKIVTMVPGYFVT